MDRPSQATPVSAEAARAMNRLQHQKEADRLLLRVMPALEAADDVEGLRAAWAAYETHKARAQGA